MIGRFISLWIGGLAQALSQAELLLRRPKQFGIDARSGVLAVSSIDQPKPEILWRVNPERIEKAPPKIVKQTKGGIFRIAVPAAAIVERQLGPLPAESLPYLDNVVAHQVEAFFPWRLPEMSYSTSVEKRTDGRLDVRVRATARSAIMSALTVAEACGAGKVLVVGNDAGNSGNDDAGIVAAVGPAAKDRQRRAQFIARWALISIALIATIAGGWTAFSWWTLSSDVAALDQAIADRRAIIKRHMMPRPADRHFGLDARKEATPPVVVVLDELSTILPDSAYLTDLSLDADHLRINGVSTNAAELVPLLERSGHFRNAVFYAPTTRLPGGTGDRFSIEVTVVSKHK